MIRLKIALLLAILLINLYPFYLIFSPPNLEIISPREKIVYNNNIEIVGKVDPRADLKLNDEKIYFDKKQGEFRINVYLNKGLNKFIFEAKKEFSFKVKKELIIFYYEQEGKSKREI